MVSTTDSLFYSMSYSGVIWAIHYVKHIGQYVI